jgi:hypothetical protein
MIILQIQPWKLLEELLKSFLAVIPNLLGALAILIIGLIVARIIAKVLRRFLKTIGVDRLAERLNEIEIVYKSNIKVVPSVLLSKVLYYFLLFVFVIAATDVLNMPIISSLMGDILNYIPVLISALFVFVIGLVASDMLKNIVKTACVSLAIPSAGIIANVVFYFVFINIVMIALSQAKIDTDFIQDNLSIILAGVVLAFSIGYGFASRNIVANFLASFYNKGKVQVGDIIEIENIEGEIIGMDGGTMTMLVDGNEVLLPLSKLATEKIVLLKKKEEREEAS